MIKSSPATRRCPKCNGNLFVNRDEKDNWYLECLQCSYTIELVIENKKKEKGRA